MLFYLCTKLFHAKTIYKLYCNFGSKFCTNRQISNFISKQLMMLCHQEEGPEWLEIAYRTLSYRFAQGFD